MHLPVGDVLIKCNRIRLFKFRLKLIRLSNDILQGTNKIFAFIFIIFKKLRKIQPLNLINRFRNYETKLYLGLSDLFGSICLIYSYVSRE
jgi:hypothetical protein